MEILGWSEIRVVVVPKAPCDLIIKMENWYGGSVKLEIHMDVKGFIRKLV